MVEGVSVMLLIILITSTSSAVKILSVELFLNEVERVLSSVG